MHRPAWRINQTGGRGTLRPTAQRRRRGVSGVREETGVPLPLESGERVAAIWCWVFPLRLVRELLVESGEREVRSVEVEVRKERGKDIEREEAKSIDVALIAGNKEQSIDRRLLHSQRNLLNLKAGHDLGLGEDRPELRCFKRCACYSYPPMSFTF